MREEKKSYEMKKWQAPNNCPLSKRERWLTTYNVNEIEIHGRKIKDWLKMKGRRDYQVFLVQVEKERVSHELGGSIH